MEGNAQVAELVCERSNGTPFTAALHNNDTIDDFLQEILPFCGRDISTAHFRQARGTNTHRVCIVTSWKGNADRVEEKRRAEERMTSQPRHVGTKEVPREKKSTVILFNEDNWKETREFLQTTKPR